MRQEPADEDTAKTRRKNAVLVGAVAAFALLSLALTGPGRRGESNRVDT